MRLQRTIKQEVRFKGIGLHTGKYSSVRLKPAPRDTGIIFKRIDKQVTIKASVDAVIDTAFSTTLGYNGVRIKTVEHILAAITGLGIDNLILEVNGPEIPILDGSSIELAKLLIKGGIAKQGKKRPFLKIINPVIQSDGNAEIAVFPYEGEKITYTINYNHTLLGEQQLSVNLDKEENFLLEIAPARTFGFLKDVKYLKANGLAKGGSFDNAIILGENEILNSSGLRFQDEFVRHKILDLIGDISLLGIPICGHIIAKRSGHTTHIKFLRKLLSRPDTWRIESGTSPREVVIFN